MTEYVIDVETDGLFPDISKVHAIVLRDVSDGTVISGTDYNYPGAVSIQKALDVAGKADMLIGHNIINFDLPVLAQVYPDFKPVGTIRDTLLLGRLLWPQIADIDRARLAKNPGYIPLALLGRQSLEAWGYRLGVYKGDFSKTTDWQEWSPEMQAYCEQDTAVTLELWKRCQMADYSEKAIEIEHRFSELLALQERDGFPFDVEKAHKLYAELCARRDEVSRELQNIFPPRIIQLKTKQKTVSFNPGSRKQIAERLIEKYGWKPESYTPSGQPEVSETILEKLDYPEAAPLCEYLMLEKRLGMLGDGKYAWLKVEREGKIHGSVNTVGAVTRRCTHNSPNIAQVPSAAPSVPYGYQCRELFYAPEGWLLVGADASGLELRCLAHYMYRYDGGLYAEEVLHGDIHTANQKAAGLETRNQAKTFIYAFLYGAGNTKIGSIVEPQASEDKQSKVGAKLRRAFLNKTPALRELVNKVQLTVKKRKYLLAIDGGRLHVRSQHSALNTLLQSCGAIVMKLATNILWDDLETAGIFWGVHAQQVAHIHDEYQILVKEDLADVVGKIAVEAIVKAGEQLGMRCPLDGEYKVGRNWAETH